MKFHQRFLMILAAFSILGCVSDGHIILPDGACVTCMNNPVTEKPANYDPNEFVYTKTEIYKRSALAATSQTTSEISTAHKTTKKSTSLKSRIATWLYLNREYGDRPQIKTIKTIRLQNGEKAYLVKLADDYRQYAIARPKLQQAKFFEDLDLFKAANQNDIVLINRKNQATILILEGGGFQQGDYKVYRRFISFKGWKVQERYGVMAESDDTGAIVCEQEKRCKITKITYQIISKNPLKISETIVTQKGHSINHMSKKVRRTKIIRIK